MAVTYGFFNSLEGDRQYNAVTMSQIFDGIIRDGVFMSIGTQLMAVSSGGMGINVGIGRAWFKSTWTYNDALLPLIVDDSELVLNRIDVVVLEIDHTDAVRANSIKIIKGTPATTPVPTSLVKTEQVNQYPICHIYIGKGVTEITQANITNKIGTTDTPFVTGILETMDIDALIAQWGTEWNEWNNEKRQQFLDWIAEQELDFENWSTAQKDLFYEWFDQFKDVIDESAAATILDLLYQHRSDYTGHIYYGEADGENNKTIIIPNTSSYNLSYIDGLAISFKNLIENTNFTSLDVNGLGPIEIFMSDGSPMRAGDLHAGSIYTVRYNGTSFILQGERRGEGSIATYGNAPGQISSFELAMIGFNPHYRK